jgi:hypothetical protein
MLSVVMLNAVMLSVMAPIPYSMGKVNFFFWNLSTIPSTYVYNTLGVNPTKDFYSCNLRIFVIS